MNPFHYSADFSLSIHIDESFDGILRGCAHDETEGCVLSGELILIVLRPTKIKSLQTKFIGEIGVNFKTTNSLGVPTADGIESRLLCRKAKMHIGEGRSMDNTRTTSFENGTYRFPFEFYVPGSLPHSFQGKHGFIKYELGAFAMRPKMNSDIHVSHPIILRRCLMNSMDPIAPASQSVVGQMHSDILSYSATAPSMVYCEGGLLTMDLNTQLKNPDKYSVVMVTCGLQERTHYRTTGIRSLTNQRKQYLDKSYPLGCSTFYPSEHEKYNPTDLHNYNAIFRLCPRVKTDTRSPLIDVYHSLVIKISIKENESAMKKAHKRQLSIESTSSNRSFNLANTLLSSLSNNHQDTAVSKPININTPTTVLNSTSDSGRIFASTTPPLSQSPSSDEFSQYSTSAESESSVTSLSTTLNQVSLLQPNVVRVTSRKNQGVEQSDHPSTSSVGANNSDSEPNHHNSRKNSLGLHIGHSLSLHHNFKPLHFHRNTASKSYECCLKVPIVVTSKEEYREGDVPALPDYITVADEPPDYRSSIRVLPPVPTYPPTSNEVN
ncbi:unnamed protein product [Mucor hiemalis]